MELTINELNDYLRKYNIKPSFQRIKVLEFLLKNKIHPTVDNIYREVIKMVPTFSKTTVYNTLKLFMEKDLVKAITIEEGEARYDIMTHIHGHFKCNDCGKVIDFEVEKDQIPCSEELDECEIVEKHFYYKGICKDCLKKIKGGKK